MPKTQLLEPLERAEQVSPQQADVSSMAQRRYKRFIRRVEERLADEDVARRLTVAGVTVRIDLDDVPAAPLMLLLDGEVAQLARATGAEHPDVRIGMCSVDLDAIFDAGQYLPLQILSGAVTFEGCVRKFLRVLPILRADIEQE